MRLTTAFMSFSFSVLLKSIHSADNTLLSIVNNSNHNMDTVSHREGIEEEVWSLDIGEKQIRDHPTS